MIYFDTSALVKKYVMETGSEDVVNLMKSEAVATSKLTYPEMLSAFVRRSKTGDISDDKLIEAVRNFEADWNCFIVIDLQDDLLPITKRLIEKYYLRGADSIHLASALWIKDAVDENVTFVASDTGLLKAAQSEKLDVMNPQEA